MNLLRDTLQISSRAHISYPTPLIAAPDKSKPSTLNRPESSSTVPGFFDRHEPLWVISRPSFEALFSSHAAIGSWLRAQGLWFRVIEFKVHIIGSQFRAQCLPASTHKCR